MTATLVLPDTQLVREARTLVEAALPQSLLYHSHRAYLLGRAWAERRRIDFDDEGFYLAALFHDLGLCPDFRLADQAFQLNSSRALRDFLEAHSVPSPRISPLSDAIDFHMQLFPRWSRGNVAGLMQIGAWMDITFLRRCSVMADAREIARQYPRSGIDLEFPRRLLGSLTSPRACAGLLLPERYAARS